MHQSCYFGSTLIYCLVILYHLTVYMKTSFTIVALCLLVNVAKAQVGIGATTPDPSSQLEIVATDKGVLIPRITLENRPGSPGKVAPVNGLLVYQVDNDPGFYYYDGTKWEKIGKNSDRPSTSFARHQPGAGVTQQILSGSGLFPLVFSSTNLSGDVTANATQNANTFTIMKSGLYHISYSINYNVGYPLSTYSYISTSEAAIYNQLFTTTLDFVNSAVGVFKGQATVQISAQTTLQLMVYKQSGPDLPLQWNTLTITKL